MKIADIVCPQPIFEANVADHVIWRSKVSGLEKTVRLWHNPNRRQLDHILAMHGEARAVTDAKQVWAWDAFESEHDPMIRYLTVHGLLDTDAEIDPLLIYPRENGRLIVYPMDISNRMVARMVGEPAVTEAYAAGGYSAANWRRWWGNDETGQVIPVDLHDDHDAYFLSHLDAFFTSAELGRLPEPGESYDVADPDDEIQNSNDALLVAAYQKGWHAVLYDTNNKHLTLRTSNQMTMRGLRKMIRTITDDVPVQRLIMDIWPMNYSLGMDDIQRFIKFGRMPPR